MNGDPSWTVLKLIQWTTEYFKGKGIDNPRLDAELLLSSLLKIDRVGLYLNYDRPMGKDELAEYREMVRRRGAHEPIQHITGRQEFWSLEFKVTPHVLSPRPDTEILVEEALKTIQEMGERSNVILDLCTGSGCIAISLAHDLKESNVFAVDASGEALSVAAENSFKNGVADRVIFLCGDLFNALETDTDIPDKFDLIVSNPPYIRTEEIPHIQPEVRDYEPRIAIDGGEDGLVFYRRIVEKAPAYLVKGGWLIMEVGEGQADQVAGMMEVSGEFTSITKAKDLAGIERVVKGRRS